MAKFISGIVKALANFIEFDEAFTAGTARGALNPAKFALAEDQLDVFYQRLVAAGADASRMSDLPWDVAGEVVIQRRAETKRLMQHRIAQREASRELNEVMGLANA